MTATERGASHIVSQTPNQDAFATAPVAGGGIVAAVADGHGHWRHLRSERGSRLAAAIGCAVGQELADRLEREKILDSQRVADGTVPDPASVVKELVTDFVVPAVIGRWREAVLADVSDDPFTDAEQGQRLPGDDPTIAYGSTLLLAIALRDWLVLAQIGDGDVVGVRADGGASLPVPPDPQLDGLVTTSLCGRDPASDFRVAVADAADGPLLAVLLATDGYGNAQLIDEWPSAFSSDLAWMLRNRDEQWLEGQLPTWTARCASSDGSADDTTVALLLSPAGLAELARPSVHSATTPVLLDPEVGSETTTVPAMLGGALPSAQMPGGLHPVEPVTMRLRHRAGPEMAGSESASIAAPGAASDEHVAAGPVRERTVPAHIPAEQAPGSPADASREQTTFRWGRSRKTRAGANPPDSSAGADA